MKILGDTRKTTICKRGHDILKMYQISKLLCRRLRKRLKIHILYIYFNKVEKDTKQVIRMLIVSDSNLRYIMTMSDHNYSILVSCRMIVEYLSMKYARICHVMALGIYANDILICHVYNK